MYMDKSLLYYILNVTLTYFNVFNNLRHVHTHQYHFKVTSERTPIKHIIIKLIIFKYC